MLRSFKEREGSLQTQLAGVPQFSADKQRLDELKVQLVYLESRFSDQYPEIIKTKVEIAALEKRLGISDQDNSGNEDGAESAGTGSLKPDNPVYVSIASQLSSIQAEIKMIEKTDCRYEKATGRIPAPRRSYASGGRRVPRAFL